MLASAPAAYSPVHLTPERSLLRSSHHINGILAAPGLALNPLKCKSDGIEANSTLPTRDFQPPAPTAAIPLRSRRPHSRREPATHAPPIHKTIATNPLLPYPVNRPWSTV